MALITVEVWDATGNKKRQVEMPDDAPMQRILAVLIEKMSFPQHGPDGQLLSYKCQHRTTGKQLLDEQTLAEVGVKDGDVLRLLPEITAGADPLFRSGFITSIALQTPRRKPWILSKGEASTAAAVASFFNKIGCETASNPPPAYRERGRA
ncbi:MAG: EsaB/YukD family protein [Tepidisphaeraceae bacterium]